MQIRSRDMKAALIAPSDLIWSNSEIDIEFAEGCYLNKTRSSIVIEGTRNGFLSFANCLIYFVNALETELDLRDLPFVKASVDLRLRINDGVDDLWDEKVLFNPDSRGYTWEMSEATSNSILVGIHSLGHLNDELHLDRDKTESDISIYCVVAD